MKQQDQFYENLKDRGYKFTHQRKIVFEAILEHEKDHVTVEELYHHIKEKYPEIGLATVYRNVQLFCEMNLVEKLNLDDGFIRYELALDKDNHRHHHLICNQCNRVIEVKEDLMDSIEKIFDENYGFLVSNHQTKFFGVCDDCRRLKDFLK